MFLFHAAVAARATRHVGLERIWLRRALAGNRNFSPLYAPEARRMLRAAR
jgi:hypothetical protein